MNDYLGAPPCGGANAASAQTAGGVYNAGISQGGSFAPQGLAATPSPSLLPGTAVQAGGGTVLDSSQFLNGYLRTLIGRSVTVQFLFGTDTLTDRTGTLMAVGANYIVVREFGTQNLLVCDFFSIKIVRVYQQGT